MRNFLCTVLILFFYSADPVHGQATAVENGLQAITGDAIRAQLGFLSSDWMEGREAGEKGEFIAADYLASMLQVYGVKPGGDLIPGITDKSNSTKDKRTYFQNFVLLKTLPGSEQILKIKSLNGSLSKSVNLTWNVDFIFRPSDPGVEIEAPIVFVGYGYINDSLKYNDFNKLDVRGKFILKMTGLPKFIALKTDKEKIASISSEMESRYLAMGVTGVLEFDPDAPVVGTPEIRDYMNMSPSEGVPRQGRQRARFSIPGKNNPENIIRITVSVKTANEILSGTDVYLDEYTRKADLNSRVDLSNLKGKSIYLKSSVKTSQIAVRNVLGIVEGKNHDKIILLGAHYDHMGIGNGYIWNGADDNGSGTIGVLTIAKAVMATGQKPENTIIFALWTAEEEGLLGSRYYVRNTGFPVENLKLNMNFDMISRYISDNEPKKVTMTYTSSFPEFREITAGNLDKYKIDLDVDYQPSANPPGGTDHRSFVEAGVPVIRFKPGHREEYHTPGDEIRTIDLDIMEKIIRIGFADTWDLANGK